MPKRYYGAEKSQRYPAGTEKAGQFKPKRGASQKTLSRRALPTTRTRFKNGPSRDLKTSPGLLPPSQFSTRNLTGIWGELTPTQQAEHHRYGKRIQRDLLASLTGISQDDVGRVRMNREQALWFEENGVDMKEAANIASKSAQHISGLMLTQIRTRPAFAKRMKAYSVIFDDFGNYPLEAIVDHESGIISLNRDIFAKSDRRNKKISSLLSTITHEYAHVVDNSITDTPNTGAFTYAFQDLHKHLAQNDQNNGTTPRWLLDSGLAYPLNGYYGMTGKDDIFRELSREYVSVVSELYWHSPEYLNALDNKLKQDGYKGTPLSTIAERVWGNVKSTSPAMGQPPVKKEISDVRINIQKDLGIVNDGYANKWLPGKSKKDYLKYMLSASERG